MYQCDNLLAKELGNYIQMCMFLICGMSENKYKQPKFEEIETGETIYYKLIQMIDKGDFNEAENIMCEFLNPGEIEDFYTMLCVYEYMNGFEDELIEKNNYSREEIMEGVQSISKKYGIDDKYY